jgi:hypothetical protein
MAGSSSLTPKPVSPSRAPKRFTLDEANRTLPLVKRIAGDIVKSQQRIADLEAAIESGSKNASQSELNQAMERFQSFLGELQRIGCHLKDHKIGLIDFICRYQGRDICLCWKLGEDHIEYWHETTTGLAGRQPISSLS